MEATGGADNIEEKRGGDMAQGADLCEKRERKGASYGSRSLQRETHRSSTAKKKEDKAGARGWRRTAGEKGKTSEKWTR